MVNGGTLIRSTKGPAMAIRKEIIEELMAEYKKPDDLIGEGGLIRQLSKALLEQALKGEMTHHLGYEKNHSRPEGAENARNGQTKKKIITRDGPIHIGVPRDREATFEPQIVKKHQRRFEGFDDKIISMYARGMTVQEIQGHLFEIYGTEVSPDLISTVTDSVMEEVTAWQTRPLERIYPIVYLDAIRIKVRHNSQIVNKAVYMAIGVNLEGNKEALGLWIAENEGAKFWMNVITEIKNRGVEDILIACVDGLKGFPEALEAVFPNTEVQLCIVHMIRNSLKYVSWKDRKELAKDLKPIYAAINEKQAKEALDDFAKKWDEKYPTISAMWQRLWQGIVPFLKYPEYIRKAIYTTNAIESLHSNLRKVTKLRGAFPSDESVAKVIYLRLRNITKKWTMPIRPWRQAINQFLIHFPGRLQLD
jgi:putative transposase